MGCCLDPSADESEMLSKSTTNETDSIPNHPQNPDLSGGQSSKVDGEKVQPQVEGESEIQEDKKVKICSATL